MDSDLFFQPLLPMSLSVKDPRGLPDNMDAALDDLGR